VEAFGSSAISQQRISSETARRKIPRSPSSTLATKHDTPKSPNIAPAMKSLVLSFSNLSFSFL